MCCNVDQQKSLIPLSRRLDLMFKKKIPSLKFGDYEITHEDRLEMESIGSRS
jgi:hypothetical protein